jgi:hypothetical protein
VIYDFRLVIENATRAVGRRWWFEVDEIMRKPRAVSGGMNLCVKNQIAELATGVVSESWRAVEGGSPDGEGIEAL